MRQIKKSMGDYPALLREGPSPPKQLYILGDMPKPTPWVAIVGSRRFSPYGRQATAQLAGELASAGVVVVSGLAYGIDTIAHQAAVEAGGQTVAVLAHGLDKIYPAGNRALAQRIVDGSGCILSEYPPGTEAFKQHFPARNRIVAGACLATLVVEAPAHSGALITANFALHANRLVMAVPGSIYNNNSAGCNNLLRSGAQVITCAKDVLDGLELSAPSVKAINIKPASAQEAEILELIKQGMTDGLELQVSSSLDAAAFQQTISLMEISGKLKNLGANQWVLA